MIELRYEIFFLGSVVLKIQSRLKQKLQILETTNDRKKKIPIQKSIRHKFFKPENLSTKEKNSDLLIHLRQKKEFQIHIFLSRTQI